MALTNIAAKNAQPQSKPYKLYDERGLFLLIHPNGSKYWRQRYKLGGKEKLLSFGVYPEISLKEARQLSADVRQKLAKGEDPSQQRKLKAEQRNRDNLFRTYALRWHQINLPRWTERYAIKVMQLLERRVLPYIGSSDIHNISNADILNLLRLMEAEDIHETTRKVRTYIQQIFTFAIAEGVVQHNPATGVIHAMKALPPATHQRSLPFNMMPEFLDAIDRDQGHPSVKLGLKLLILTMVRTGEVRFGRWDEIDFEKRLWCIPANRMKMRKDHLIPLSSQAMAILHELKKFAGNCPYILRTPNSIDKPLSEAAFLVLIKRIGYKEHTTTHGLRATASTVLNEAGFRAEVIEKQLAHEERNQVRKAYNRADYLEERRDMLQWWADKLFTQQ